MEWKPFSFAQRVFLQVKTVFSLSGNQFLKKDHTLTNATDFLASGNHFLPFFQTAIKMEENDSRKWKNMVSTSQKSAFVI